MKYIHGFLLSLANFCKRFYYVNKTILIRIGNMYSWLLFSKEHTSFSFKLSNKNKLFLIQNIGKDFDINKDQLKEIFSFADSVKTIKPSFSMFDPKTVDVNFKSNFDYTILVLVLLKNIDSKFIYEFGFNQGRLPLLLSKYRKHEEEIEFLYYGIDSNKRKGGLYQSQKSLDKDNINLFFMDTTDFLKKHFDYDKFCNSILLSTTHEKNSEDSLFNFLLESNTTPKIIISDNIAEDSAYQKFIKEKNNYSSSIYIFEDDFKNHQPIYIGVSKKLT